MSHWLLVACIASFAFAGSAQAESILLDDCDSQGCQGLTLFLDIQDNGGTFDVTLTMNADDYTGVRSGLNQVGFLGIKDWTSVTLDSAPTSGWSDPLEANNSSNNLCEKGTSTDKICTFGFVDITGGGDFSWTFTVTGGTLLADTSKWHVGGQFANGAGVASGQIISAVSPPIPEPGAAVFFGIGLAVISPFLRRRRHHLRLRV